MSNTGYYDTSYPPSLWAPVVPAITTIAPTTGVTATPVSLTVNGSGFVNPSTVKMGAVSLATTFVSATRLTATGTLPAAGTVQVTVVNANGTSNQKPFTVTATEIVGEETTEPEPQTYEAIPVESPPETTEEPPA